VFFVVFEFVIIEFCGDGRIARFGFFVLIEDPFKRGAVAELVVPCLCRDAV
jgi:hypothetical protein